MCTAVKKSMQEILAAINTTELVVEIRPKDVTSSKTCVTHLHQNHQTCSTPSPLCYRFQPKNRLNLNGNIIILLATNRNGMKWHRIMATTLFKSTDYLNSQNCKTFPTRSQFPYECLNYPYCVSFIFKLVCFSRFQPGMVNPNIPVYNYLEYTPVAGIH